MIYVNPVQLVLFILLLSSCQSANQNNENSKNNTTVPANGNDRQTDIKQHKYISDGYQLSVTYPQQWEAEEFRKESQFPVINFYPASQKEKMDLPLTVHADGSVSYVGIYPKGYGVELPMGDNRSYGGEYVLPLNFSVNREESLIFLLENGEAWGYFIIPASPPESWEEHGFLFFQVATDNFEARCYEKETGKELNMRECDPMTGDTIKRFGNVRSSAKEAIKQIAESIEMGERAGGSGQEQHERQTQGIRVESPDAGATISSTVTMNGEARGNWYFEAEFTVDLIQDGETLATGIVKAQEEWMTEDFVEFSATLDIPDGAASGKAELVFRNSNPSEKPELDKSYRLPVKVERDQ